MVIQYHYVKIEEHVPGWNGLITTKEVVIQSVRGKAISCEFKNKRNAEPRFDPQSLEYAQVILDHLAADSEGRYIVSESQGEQHIRRYVQVDTGSFLVPEPNVVQAPRVPIEPDMLGDLVSPVQEISSPRRVLPTQNLDGDKI